MMLFITSSTFLILSPSWKTSLPLLTFLLLYFNTYLALPSHLTTIQPTFLMDTISIPLTILTLLTTILMFLNSTKIKTLNMHPHHFSSTLLLLNLFLSLAFNLNTLMKFYILFESALIPTLILILIWGYQPERLQAGQYLMLYTVVASLPLFISILYLLSFLHSSHYSPMTSPLMMSPILTTMMTLAFLVKLPMYLLHLWLPKAHVEAPVAGSMILASVLLKLGSYGLIRILKVLPFMYYIHSPLKPLLISIAMMGAALTALLCLRLHDLKELVAYASVSHMSLVAATIATNTHLALTATMLMNISHGITSSMMFSLSNLLYENTHTRSLFMTKSLMTIHPHLMLWWCLAILANGGAPPFASLLSEMMIFTSTSTFSYSLMIYIFLTAFFSMTYSIYLYMNLHHGKPTPTSQFSTIQKLPHTSCLLHMAPMLLMISLTPLL